MAEKLFQILVIPEGENRWRFVAHGAAYGATEAENTKAAYLGRGARVKLLPVVNKAAKGKANG